MQNSSILEALKIHGLFVDCSIDTVDPKPKEGSALDLSGSCILVIMQVLDISHAIGPHWCNRTSTTYSMGQDRSIHKKMARPSMRYRWLSNDTSSHSPDD